MFKRYSITFWATAFVGVVCFSLVAIDGWRSWNARSLRLLEMERQTSNLTRAMVQHADDTMLAADTALADLVERIETDGRSPAALARLHRQMVAQVDRLPQVAGLFVYDQDGNRLVNSLPAMQPGVNYADREYFIYHRTHNDASVHVGAPLIGRSRGKWLIPLTRRLNRPDGSFGGVVLAGLDIEYFRRYYQSFDVGQRGTVTLVSDQGQLLLRRPFAPEQIGRDLRDTRLYRMYAGSRPPDRSGSYLSASPLDGEERLTSFRALRHYPLFVTAALSKDEMLEQWRRDTILHALGVLLLAALLGFFGKRLVDQIRLRVKTEAELVEARDALESANRTLERQAMQDGLTGLANRRQLDIALENEFSRAIRHHDLLAFVMIDVDFKQYNDIYGHSAGDDCLRTVSRLIRVMTPKRPGDVTARYGGEEIAILLPNTDAAGAQAVAERIRRAIENMQLQHSGSALGCVTVSAGVAAIAPRRGEHLSGMLVEAADKALYAAKAAGRNRVMAAPDDAIPGSPEH